MWAENGILTICLPFTSVDKVLSCPEIQLKTAERLRENH